MGKLLKTAGGKLPSLKNNMIYTTIFKRPESHNHHKGINGGWDSPRSWTSVYERKQETLVYEEETWRSSIYQPHFPATKGKSSLRTSLSKTLTLAPCTCFGSRSFYNRDPSNSDSSFQDGQERSWTHMGVLRHVCVRVHVHARTHAHTTHYSVGSLARHLRVSISTPPREVSK